MELYAIERRRWLVDQARSAGRIEVSEVARELTVAKETVRRDLSALEAEGLLRRVHGGAVPIERAGFEGALTLRSGDRQAEKSRIARAALGLLGSAEIIYIDEGSTTQEFAEQLHPHRELTVVTNALPIALMMAQRQHVNVIMVGGRIRTATLSTTDSWAGRMLEDFVFDICFLGANGITAERGLSCPHPGVGALKARAVAASRRRVLLTDSAKFGVDSSYRFARVRDLHVVVTDRGADETSLARVRSLGVEVLTA
ncbi:DeoR/GlpR family DNA-binding transcription regulator [Spongisporangium articulatum]|uniref:Lactose phosphotransferase system repressor n=1 Tax=Spongisporangium articulatum TaxID=3362603 RepID=A0ABW8AQS1_9ACTN